MSVESNYNFPWPYLLTDDTFSVFLQSGTFSIDRTATHWDRIVSAVNGTDPVATEDELIGLISAVSALEEGLKSVYGTTEGAITVENGTLFWNDQRIDNSISAKFMDLYREGFSTEGFVRFAEKVYSNPWMGAREELYPWLEACELPIFPDGDIMAYKRVNPDYTDCHTSTIDNHIGRVITMDRNEVDQNRRELCSTGLHFCSKHYLSGFHPGSPVMLIKINPADIVSVPYSSQGKGRCSRYEVIGEIPQDEVYTKVWPAQVDTSDFWYDEDESDWDDDEDEDDEVHLFFREEGEEVEQPEDEPLFKVHGVIQSTKFGTITRATLLGWVDKHGSYAGVARAFGVSTGTVQAWKTKLGLV